MRETPSQVWEVVGAFVQAIKRSEEVGMTPEEALPALTEMINSLPSLDGPAGTVRSPQTIALAAKIMRRQLDGWRQRTEDAASRPAPQPAQKATKPAKPGGSARGS